MKDSYHHGNLKHDLMEAAIGVISEKGFDALSLRGIAALCGVSHNAIYRHFSGKEQLITACRAHVTARLMERLSAAAEGTGNSAGAALTRLSATYVAFYQQHPTQFRRKADLFNGRNRGQLPAAGAVSKEIRSLWCRERLGEGENAGASDPAVGAITRADRADDFPRRGMERKRAGMPGKYH